MNSHAYRRIEINKYEGCNDDSDILGTTTELGIRTKMKDVQISTPWGTLDVARKEKPPRYELKGDPVGVPMDAADEKAVVLRVFPSRKEEDVNISQASLENGLRITIFEYKNI